MSLYIKDHFTTVYIPQQYRTNTKKERNMEPNRHKQDTVTGTLTKQRVYLEGVLKENKGRLGLLGTTATLAVKIQGLLSTTEELILTQGILSDPDKVFPAVGVVPSAYKTGYSGWVNELSRLGYEQQADFLDIFSKERYFDLLHGISGNLLDVDELEEIRKADLELYHTYLVSGTSPKYYQKRELLLSLIHPHGVVSSLPLYNVYFAYKGLDSPILYVGKGKGDRYRHVNSGISTCKAANKHYFTYGEIHCLPEFNYLTNQEALDLEGSLIKELQPEWNIQGK